MRVLRAARVEARRLLLSRLVIDHQLASGDPFRLDSGTTQRAITDLLLGDRDAGLAEVGELLGAA